MQVYLLKPGSLIKVKNFEQKSKSIFKSAVRKYGENRENLNSINNTISIMVKLGKKWLRVVKTKKLIKLILRQSKSVAKHFEALMQSSNSPYVKF